MFNLFCKHFVFLMFVRASWWRFRLLSHGWWWFCSERGMKRLWGDLSSDSPPRVADTFSASSISEFQTRDVKAWVVLARCHQRHFQHIPEPIREEPRVGVAKNNNRIRCVRLTFKMAIFDVIRISDFENFMKSNFQPLKPHFNMWLNFG